MGILRRGSGKRFNNSESEITSGDDILLRALLSGQTIDRQSALSIPAVASAVERISNTVASVPFKLYREDKNADGKNTVTVIDDDRVTLVNDDTGDTLDAFQFKKQLVTDYLLGKGGYAYINRRRNKVLSLHYVEEQSVGIMINSDKIFKNYKISVGGKNYEPYEFLKIIRQTKDGASGVPVTTELSNALQAAFEMLRYQLKNAQTDGSKRGFITSKNRLEKEAIKSLKDAWRNMYSGNSEKVVVLNEGLEFKESAATALEMQINETRQSLNSEINEIFGISDDEEKYNRRAIVPIINQIVTALNRDLLLETEKIEGYYWAADMSEITKLDMKSRFDAYKSAVDAKWMTRNEIRFIENMPPLDGFDVIEMSLGNVFFNPKTGEFYVPNTGEVIEFGSENKTSQGKSKE